MSENKFETIMDRQLAPSAKGETERQACGERGKGYGHKKSVRKRMASRLAR